MKTLTHKSLMAMVALIASLAIVNTGTLQAQDRPVSPPGKEEPDKHDYFTGKIVKLDVEEKWLQVDKQKVLVEKETKIMHRDQEIELKDLRIGMEIHGLAKKNGDGELTATIIKTGPKPNETPGTQPQK